MFGLPEFLVFGGLFFWAFVALISIVLIVNVDREQPLWASLWIVIGLTLLFIFGDGQWVTWIWQNPLLMLYGVLAYIGIGIAWTFGKWWFFLLNASDWYAEKRKAFLTKKGWKGVTTDDEKQELKLAIASEAKYGHWRGQSFPPEVSDNKRRILIWLMYWPFSMVWTLVNDPVRRIGLFIFERISNVLAQLSKRTFGKFNEFN